MPAWCNRATKTKTSKSEAPKSSTIPTTKSTTTKCPHPQCLVDFSIDYSCGAWFDTCTGCGEIVASGMVGHN